MLLLIISVFTLLCAACGPVEIAASNTSPHDLLDLNFHSIEWGNLAADATTDFFEVDEAYDYTYVHFFIDQVEFLIQPIDYVGETSLSPGRYIYELVIDDPSSGDVTVNLISANAEG